MSIRKLRKLMEGVYDPHIFKAVIVTGSPAAGKSTLSTLLRNTYGLRIVDSDPQLELLMDRAGLDLDMENLTPDEHIKKDALRDIAKEIRNKDLHLKIENALGIAYPTDMDYKTIAHLKEKLEHKGYETFLLFIDVPLSVALQRNKERPRSIPQDALINIWRRSHEEYTKASGLFRTNTQVIDGTLSPDEFELTSVNKFLNSPVRNQKAQNWIDLQLMIKKNI